MASSMVAESVLFLFGFGAGSGWQWLRCQLLTYGHWTPESALPAVTVLGIKWDKKVPAENFSAVYGNVLRIKGVDIFKI